MAVQHVLRQCPTSKFDTVPCGGYEYMDTCVLNMYNHIYIQFFTLFLYIHIYIYKYTYDV